MLIQIQDLKRKKYRDTLDIQESLRQKVLHDFSNEFYGFRCLSSLFQVQRAVLEAFWSS